MKNTLEVEFESFGYPSTKPCLVCKCTKTMLEPRFGYAVCINHFKMSPVEIQKKQRDLSYVHLRINIRSYYNTDDNRAKDGIRNSKLEIYQRDIVQPYRLYHFTKKLSFNSKF